MKTRALQLWGERRTLREGSISRNGTRAQLSGRNRARALNSDRIHLGGCMPPRIRGAVSFPLQSNTLVICMPTPILPEMLTGPAARIRPTPTEDTRQDGFLHRDLVGVCWLSPSCVAARSMQSARQQEPWRVSSRCCHTSAELAFDASQELVINTGFVSMIPVVLRKW